MSALSLSKPITFKSASSARGRSISIAGVGSTPRAHLLPPSVIAAQRGRRQVRVMIAGLVALSVVVAAGVGAAGYLAISRTAVLDAERATTSQLAADQAQYSDVAASLSAIDSLTSARSTVGALDVDWAAYIAQIRGLMPEGFALTGVTIDSSTPISAVPAQSGTLAADRVASLRLTVSSPELVPSTQWIDGLATLPGYVDAALTSSTRDDNGTYRTTVTLAVDSTVYSGLYTTEAAQ